METLKVLFVFYCVGIAVVWIKWCVHGLMDKEKKYTDSSELVALLGIICSVLWPLIAWYLITERCMSYRKGK